MTHLTLLKTSNAIQLAHLYEHIFCAHIDSLFYENGLFQYIDYSLSGKTYYGGVVLIEVELYTEGAAALSNQIADLSVVFNEETMSTAASQLLAEKEVPFDGLGYEAVKTALEELHRQPWVNLDQVGVIDTKTIRRKVNPFYISEGNPLPARKLTTSISIDPTFIRSQRELLPLFRLLAKAITDNIQHTLNDSYGFFSVSDSFSSTSQKIQLVNTFKIAHLQEKDIELNDLLQTCLQVLEDLDQQNGFTRLIKQLQSTSYTEENNAAPCIESMYEDTLIFIGTKGWQHTASTENCKILFRQMSIEVGLGREKVHSPLFQY